MDSAKIEARKETAQAWFEALRDRLLTALEDVERALPAGAPLSDRAAGQFARTPWQRTEHTGAPGGGDGGVAQIQVYRNRQAVDHGRRASKMRRALRSKLHQAPSASRHLFSGKKQN